MIFYEDISKFTYLNSCMNNVEIINDDRFLDFDVLVAKKNTLDPRILYFRHSPE